MDELSGSVENSGQNDSDQYGSADENVTHADYGVTANDEQSDNDVMGDAVRNTQKTKQAQQAKAIAQKIKLSDREYDPAELESLIKDVPNYKKGMNQAFEETNKLKNMLRQIEQKFGQAKDPEEFLRMRFNEQEIEKALETMAERKVREFQMTPEQRQWEQDKREKAELQQQVAQHKEQQEKYYAQKLEQHYANDYDQQFQAQIASRNLPYTKMDLREMANLIAIGHGKGVDMDFATAAEQMLENRRSGLKMYLNELAQKDPEGNLLEEWLKDTNVIKTIQNRLIKKVKSPGQPVKRIQANQPSPSADSGSTMTPQQWRQYMKSR